MNTAKRSKLVYFANRGLYKAFTCLMAIGIIALLAVCWANMQSGGVKNDDYTSRENDAYSIGVQAYIYGLAPVIMENTEKIFVTMPGPAHAPVNQFGRVTHLATPNDTIIVTPNSDTLYSSAWLELGDGPIVLHVPDTNGRYYVMQLLDAYTNSFNSVGRRTTGTGEGDFAIVGPGWNGSLPAGVKEIKSPTNTVWIVGRILVNGQNDVSNVTALQDQFKLTPLSQYGKTSVGTTRDLSTFKKYSPSANVQANLTFFEDLRVALKNNPPPQGEAALMAVFDRIGLGNNETPYGKDLDPAVAAGLARAIKDGDGIVKSAWKQAGGKNINGWVMTTDIGTYGYDYLTRAVVAEGGLAANVPREAVYPKATTDSNGDPLNGANRYVIHFEKGNLPPVDAFWSVTMYNASTYMLVANPIGRYAIGDRTPGLVFNPDGSLDIYIQHDAPAGKGSNWLPADAGKFYLILRMYQPKPQVLNGTYQIPPMKMV